MSAFIILNISMIIKEIYTQYTIPPHLQQHMLRVAWVCKLICNNRIGDTLPVHDILTVWLTHDLWNILKFNMELYPEIREPEWIEYRSKVKHDFLQYWSDEHEATKNIASMCNISDSGMHLLKMFDEYNDDKLLDSSNIALWITDYADSRVAVSGVTTVKDRVEKIIQRNMKNKWWSFEKATQVSENRKKTALSMEKEIFSQCDIAPDQINDQTIQPFLEDLLKFDISISVF